MNNKVEVWFEEDDETETYKIVTNNDARIP